MRSATAITIAVLAGWCVMAFMHETGHVVTSLALGGSVSQTELRPWRLPYTLFQSDPYPLVTLWGGPVLGCLVPMACWAGARCCLIQKPGISKIPATETPILDASADCDSSSWILVDFVGWFCVLANGVYLVTGLIDAEPLLDSNRMRAEGCPAWIIIAIGFAAVVISYRPTRKTIMRLVKSPPSWWRLAGYFGVLAMTVFLQTLISILVG